MPQSVPTELHDEIPTRDRAPMGQQQQQPRALNLAVPGQPSTRLANMLGLSQDGGVPGGAAGAGVMGSKDEFWQELKQISQSRKQRPQTSYPGGVGGSNEGSSTHHGQQWINFELHGK